jgi:chromosome segregation ATPase
LSASNAVIDGTVELMPQSPVPQTSDSVHTTALLPVQGLEELQQQFAGLQKQLEAVQGNYAALQQVSTEQAKAIERLQTQLEQRKVEQTVQQDRYDILQQKAIEQMQTIEHLRERIAMLDQHMEPHLSDQRIQPRTEAAGYQNESETIVLSEVQQQIAGLQTEFNHQAMEQMTQQQRHAILQRQCDEQAQMIAELRDLVKQEQRYAAIGEAHLNKWRYRTFLS